MIAYSLKRLGVAILVAILGAAAVGGTADDFDKAWLMIAISAGIAGVIALGMGSAGKVEPADQGEPTA